jgi:hypothetical protein
MDFYKHLRPAGFKSSISEKVVVLYGRSGDFQYHQYQSADEPYNALVRESAERLGREESVSYQYDLFPEYNVRWRAATEE